MQYLILLCLIVPLHTFAETSVWRVSKGDSELLIGGTVHVLSLNDYPLPIEFEKAYKLAKLIVFEADITALAKPKAQQQLMRRVMYIKGRTLKDDLTAKTYKTLSHYLKTKGLTISTFSRFKPPMVMITLVMAELQRLGMANTGVDAYFDEKAKTDGKTTSGLESLQTQLDVIENMGKGQEDEMIMSTIAEMKELPSIMSDLKAAWRKGDSQRLEKLGISPMKTDYPKLFRLLLVDRNNAWIPKIESLLATPEVEFIMVGALHLIGDEGVLSKLRKLGYKVELF